MKTWKLWHNGKLLAVIVVPAGVSVAKVAMDTVNPPKGSVLIPEPEKEV